jgi:hypothetical protein
MTEMEAVTLRPTNGTDGRALQRLAELESRRFPPTGPHLVAVTDGRVDAAISLSTGEVIADPFRRTAELCELLRLHARSRRVARYDRRARRARPRPALAPT